MSGWTLELRDLYPEDFGSDVRGFYFISERGGPRVGLVECHLKSDGEPCMGTVPFDVPGAEKMWADDQRPRWQVVQNEPLTLSPSILCRLCGHHGWIRDGRWVAA